jgi:hypothetical protein
MDPNLIVFECNGQNSSVLPHYSLVNMFVLPCNSLVNMLCMSYFVSRAVNITHI